MPTELTKPNKEELEWAKKIACAKWGSGSPGGRKTRTRSVHKIALGLAARRAEVADAISRAEKAETRANELDGRPILPPETRASSIQITVTPRQARELAHRSLVHLRTAQAALRFEALVRGADSTVAPGAVTKLLDIVTLLSQTEAVLLEVGDLSEGDEVLECLATAVRRCAEALDRVKRPPDDLWETPGMVANLRRVSQLLDPHVTLSSRTATGEEGS